MTSISRTSPILIAITPLGTAWGNRRAVGVCVFQFKILYYYFFLARGDIQKLSAVEKFNCHNEMLFQIKKYRLLIKSRHENEIILEIYCFINTEFTRLRGLLSNCS